MSNVFDIVKAIRTKQNIPEWPDISKEYVPFIVNRAMSFDLQTILLANEVNKTHFDPQWAYQFLVTAVNRTTKYSPWIKANKPHPEDTLKAVCEYYNCSLTKAVDACNILTQEELDIILNKGGTSKR